jgi:phosphoribosylaminoimidazole-succinocarboxamide synthase
MSKNIKRKQVYNGNGKILYEGAEPGTIVFHFKDEVVTRTTKKQGTVVGKGVINNRISELVFNRLGDLGIHTHFIRSINMREQLVRYLEMIPLRVVVRNVAAGDMCKRLGLEEGTVLPKPITEFYLSSLKLEDPLVNDDHITAFGWAEPLEIDEIKTIAARINDFLSGMFIGIGTRLVDFKLEFGKMYINEIETIVLGDEISLDTCRLWDLRTNERFGKDLFRHSDNNSTNAYNEIAKRLGLMVD